jgi:transposase-like protein
MAITGRPTKYNNKFNEQAYIACVEGGFTDLKLARLFDVDKATVNRWKKKYPEFCDSLKKGKDEFNILVAEASLLKRLKGFSFIEVTEKADKTGKMVTVKQVRKHVAPDTTALIFFLKNRDPERWRDKREIEGTLTLEDAINQIEGDG